MTDDFVTQIAKSTSVHRNRYATWDVAKGRYVKPHYRLHFHWFDGKTPLWWVECIRNERANRCTNGFRHSENAVASAVAL